MNFSGATYTPERDRERLVNQLFLIRDYMLGRGWRTCEEVAEALGLKNVNSVSAQFRNLRKIGLIVERRWRNGVVGWSEYRVTEIKFVENQALLNLEINQ